MKTNNPVFRNDVFSKAAESWKGELMTLDGTSMKAGVLTLLMFAGAFWPWHLYFQAHVASSALTPYMIGGTLAGFVVALITIFNKQFSPVTAPLYAVLEGLALGAVSVAYETQFPGIGVEAVGLTFAVLGVFLLAYTTRLVRPSAGFMKAVAIATGGIAVYYLVAMVLMFFGIHAPMIWDTGIFGIGFSVVVTVVAALNLFTDFAFIEAGVESRAPKYMEWYGAFGLMVTIVWLYLEILRLASKLRSNK
ncbi:MAG TPA: Bax inhibitor-1/YccA family protein [Drouetiella sp.]